MPKMKIIGILTAMIAGGTSALLMYGSAADLMQ